MNAISSSFFAAASWGILTVAMLIPMVFGAPSETLVVASAFVVGMQSAQSVLVQIAPPWRVDLRLMLAVFTAALVPAGLSGLSSEPFLVASLGTLSGAAVGIIVGVQALETINRAGGLAFQRYQAGRSVATLVGVGILSAVWPLGAGWASMALAVSLLLPTTILSLTSRCARPGELLIGISTKDEWGNGLRSVAMLFVGVGASLVYRNDVTWLRASLADDSEFTRWHVALVGYTAVQGIIGFVVVQRFFVHRARLRPRLINYVHRWRANGMFSWSVLSSFVICLSLYGSVWIVVGSAAALASIIGVLSGLAHVVGRSLVPYMAGLLGSAVLLMVLSLMGDARLALVASNVTIGFVILVGVSFFRKA